MLPPVPLLVEPSEGVGTLPGVGAPPEPLLLVEPPEGVGTTRGVGAPPEPLLVEPPEGVGTPPGVGAPPEPLLVKPPEGVGTPLPLEPPEPLPPGPEPLLLTTGQELWIVAPSGTYCRGNFSFMEGEEEVPTERSTRDGTPIPAIVFVRVPDCRPAGWMINMLSSILNPVVDLT